LNKDQVQQQSMKTWMGAAPLHALSLYHLKRVATYDNSHLSKVHRIFRNSKYDVYTYRV